MWAINNLLTGEARERSPPVIYYPVEVATQEDVQDPAECERRRKPPYQEAAQWRVAIRVKRSGHIDGTSTGASAEIRVYLRPFAVKRMEHVPLHQF